jgi:hypothetical protein
MVCSYGPRRTQGRRVAQGLREVEVADADGSLTMPGGGALIEEVKKLVGRVLPRHFDLAIGVQAACAARQQGHPPGEWHKLQIKFARDGFHDDRPRHRTRVHQMQVRGVGGAQLDDGPRGVVRREQCDFLMPRRSAKCLVRLLRPCHSRCPKTVGISGKRLTG